MTHLVDAMLEKHKKIIVTVPFKGGRAKRPFVRIVKEGKLRNEDPGMNMAKIFISLSRAGTWLFWSLTESRNDRTNIAEFKSGNLTPVEKKRVSAGYKELHKLDVIKRTKQNHYLFNPNAIHPANDDFDNVLNNWKQTK